MSVCVRCGLVADDPDAVDDEIGNECPGAGEDGEPFHRWAERATLRKIADHCYEVRRGGQALARVASHPRVLPPGWLVRWPGGREERELFASRGEAVAFIEADLTTSDHPGGGR